MVRYRMEDHRMKKLLLAFAFGILSVANASARLYDAPVASSTLNTARMGLSGAFEFGTSTAPIGDRTVYMVISGSNGIVGTLPIDMGSATFHGTVTSTSGFYGLVYSVDVSTLASYVNSISRFVVLSNSTQTFTGSPTFHSSVTVDSEITIQGLAVKSTLDAHTASIGALVSTSEKNYFTVTVGTFAGQLTDYYSLDETAWVNASTTCVAKGGGTVKALGGTWKFVSTVTVPSGVVWQGEGSGTVIESTVTYAILSCSGTIRGLNFKFPSAETNGKKLIFNGGAVMENCEISRGFNGLAGADPENGSMIQILNQNLTASTPSVTIRNNWFHDLDIKASDISGFFLSSGSSVNFHDNLFENVQGQNSTTHMIRAIDVSVNKRSRMIFRNNTMLNVDGRLFSWVGTSMTVLDGNYFEMSDNPPPWGIFCQSVDYGAGAVLNKTFGFVMSNNTLITPASSVLPANPWIVRYEIAGAQACSILNNRFFVLSGYTNIMIPSGQQGTVIHGNINWAGTFVNDSGTGTRFRDNFKVDATLETEN
jgi:hypothetical protein